MHYTHTVGFTQSLTHSITHPFTRPCIIITCIIIIIIILIAYSPIVLSLITHPLITYSLFMLVTWSLSTHTCLFSFSPVHSRPLIHQTRAQCWGFRDYWPIVVIKLCGSFHIHYQVRVYREYCYTRDDESCYIGDCIVLLCGLYLHTFHSTMCWEYSQNVTHTISIIAFPPVTRHTPMYMYRQYMYMYDNNNNYCDNPNVEFMLYGMLMVLYYLIVNLWCLYCCSGYLG